MRLCLGAPLDHLDAAGDRGGLELPAAQQAGPGEHGGERRPELVRHGGEELVLQAVRLALLGVERVLDRNRGHLRELDEHVLVLVRERALPENADGADRGAVARGERRGAGQRRRLGRAARRRRPALPPRANARLRHRLAEAEERARAVGHDRKDILGRARGIDRERGARELVELRGALAELGRLPADLLGLPEELDEHRHLGAQHLGHDRRQDVIDRAEPVPARHVRLVAVGGDEDDRRVLAARPRPDERRGLEAVHDRHAHVEQDDGEVPVEERPQRLLPGADLHDVLAELGEDRLERDQLVGVVVYHQDVDPIVQDRPPTVSTRAGGWRGAARCRPASRGSPRRRPRCISPGRPSSPWRSAQRSAGP